MSRKVPVRVLLNTILLWSITGLLMMGCAPGKHHAASEFQRIATYEGHSGLNERRFHKVRFEGRTRWESALAMTSYLRKYGNKRIHGTPSQAIRWFQCHGGVDEMSFLTMPDGAVSVVLAGDLMWAGRVQSGFVDPMLLRWLQAHDVVIANLETPIDTTRRVPSLLPDYVRYNSPPELIDGFRCPETGRSLITAVSLANNHLFDFGASAALHTMHWLSSREIGYAGARPATEIASPYLLLEKNGFRIGMFAAAYGLNSISNDDFAKVYVNLIPGIAPFDPVAFDLSSVDAALQQMRADSIDLCIVSLHWGHEYELLPDIYQQNMAQQIVRLGADILLGHHPHEIQPTEIILVNGYSPGSDVGCYLHVEDLTGLPRKALVAYSPGNFVTRMFTPSCRMGALESITIYRDTTSGRVDWHRNPRQYVVNEPAYFIRKKHRLRLAHDSAEIRKAAPWIR